MIILVVIREVVKLTTIAYRDGIISYDSLITSQGVAVYSDYDKLIIRDGVHFFMTGALSDRDVLIDNWFSSKQRFADASALVFDGANLYEVGHHNARMWREKIELDKFLAIGSGWQFALMAMDMGASAEEALIRTSVRDIYTGGIIRTFKLP